LWRSIRFTEAFTAEAIWSIQLRDLRHAFGAALALAQPFSAYEQASGRTIPIRVVARREGDAARSVADRTYLPRQLALVVPEPEGLLAAVLHLFPL